jgi:hypothetical protein
MIKISMILASLILPITALSQTMNTPMYSKVEKYISLNPKIIQNIKQSYDSESYGKCLAVFMAFEADITKGNLKLDEATAFNQSVAAVSLGIARKNLLKNGVKQAELSSIRKTYTSQFNEANGNQKSMTQECMAIDENNMVNK